MPAPFRIVLADDSPTTRAAVGDAIGREGDLRLVGRAKDGEDALAVLREQRPDVALLDVLMPGMSGGDVVRELRAELPGTAFVLMSTLSEPELALRAALSGAAMFVDKARGPDHCVAVALAAARRWDGVR